MPTPSWIIRGVNRRRAFTLVELLVAMTVLVILVGMIAQMTNGVSKVVNLSQAHIDTDAQARALLDRMAIDFGGMVKRPDVDYYLKGRPTTLVQAGNDQIAFYSETSGYFTSSTSGSTDTTPQGPFSLIAYRVNPQTLHMERLCKGLVWNGASSGISMGFLPIPLASPLPSPLPSPMATPAPTPLLLEAADPISITPDLYEEMGPQVFRFEYYYVLKGQTAPSAVAALSIVPWYAAAPLSHTSVNGMQDVAGIGVLIAVIDSRSRQLVSNNQLATLAQNMEDAPDSASGNSAFTSPASIEAAWTTAIDTSSLPRTAVAGIKIYTRCFYLNGVSP